MLIVAASLLTLISLTMLLLTGQAGVLIALFAKPIIDATWNYAFGGWNLLEIMGVFVPTIVLLRALFNRYKLADVPFFGLWLIYIFYNALTFSAHLFESSALVGVELTLRLLHGLAGFYMMQAFFADREGFRRLLIVLILAGAFPLLIGLYQVFTGEVWRKHLTVGMMRYVGLYHDAVSLRMFGFQTLTAIIR
jgi:hypothetical protein